MYILYIVLLHALFILIILNHNPSKVIEIAKYAILRKKRKSYHIMDILFFFYISRADLWP